MLFRTGALVLSRRRALTCCVRIPSASYAKKIAKGAAPLTKKRERMEVETDPDKLVNFVCGGNIYLDGKDPEIKPDSEYPDWLWTLRTDRGALHPDELEFDTWQYWKRVRKLQIRKDLVRLKQEHKYM